MSGTQHEPEQESQEPAENQLDTGAENPLPGAHMATDSGTIKVTR